MSRVRITRDRDLISRLDEATFPGEPLGERSLRLSTWWIATIEGEPVGHAGCRVVDDGVSVYLNRAGVLSAARGHGIQRALIQARLRWGRRRGIKYFVTYTSLDNPRSANNLIQCGFRLYVPACAWAGRSFLYWQRAFTKEEL